jgi:anti-sigma factor RsiW
VSDPRCEEFRELVSAFVDERLEGAELLRLEGHLETCAGCREFERELRRFGELLQAAEAFRPLRRPPPGFAAAVAARAVRHPVPALPAPAPRPAGRLVFPLSWAALAAAAAAALLFGWSWQRLLPIESPEQLLASRPALVAPAAGEGSMDDWMREHAMVARDGTLLGSAEEVEVVSYRTVGADGR